MRIRDHQGERDDDRHLSHHIAWVCLNCSTCFFTSAGSLSGLPKSKSASQYSPCAPHSSEQQGIMIAMTCHLFCLIMQGSGVYWNLLWPPPVSSPINGVQAAPGCLSKSFSHNSAIKLSSPFSQQKPYFNGSSVASNIHNNSKPDPTWHLMPFRQHQASTDISGPCCGLKSSDSGQATGSRGT